MAEEPQQHAEVSPEPAKKTRAPRKSVRKTATPAAEEAGAAAAPDKPKKTNTRIATRKRSTKTTEAPAAAQPEAAPAPVSTPAPVPAPAAPSPAPAEDARNAKPLNTSEERADTSSEERPLVRNLEQSPQKPVSVPGFATPETVGGEQGGGNGRRKRRRNRNRRGEGGNNAPQTSAPLRVDAEELNRRAWKIFLGEVTEEGLALMDDRTAAEAARRAFRVAELFLQEAARHRPAPTPEPVDAVDSPEEEPEEGAEA
ncbi:MAG: hypothetical protein ACI4P8_05355 [Akkermansia sp.]